MDVERYELVGVNYFHNDPDIEIDLDSLESFYDTISSKNRTYTQVELSKLNDLAGVEITKYLHFFPVKDGYTKAHSLKYMFAGIKPSLISDEMHSEIMEYFLPLKPLSRYDIEQGSQRFGLSMYDRCDWHTLHCVEYRKEGENHIFCRRSKKDLHI